MLTITRSSFFLYHQYDRVSEGNDSQERKSSFEKLPSFHSSDTLASPGQLQQVQDQTTERSTDGNVK